MAFKTTIRSWPPVVKICFGAMLLLLLGGLVFWRERMLFYDAAFISFRIINMGSLQIMEHRYGSFITQLVPLAGAWMGWTLKAILIAYSVSFPVFYLLVFYLLCRWRAFPLAILLTLYFTLLVSGTFFWTNNEVHQGTAWLFLWLGWMWRGNTVPAAGWSLAGCSLLLIPLSVFTHPLIIFSAVFLWVFLLLDKRMTRLPRWLIWFNSLWLLATVLVKQQMSRAGWYDSDKISQITGAGFKDIIAALGNDMSLNFLRQLATNYWVFVLVSLWGMVVLFRAGKLLTGLWLMGSMTVLYVLICLSFPEWLLFHAESEWMTFSLMGATPFVFYVLPKLKSRKAGWLVGMLLVVRFIYIGMAAPAYVARQQLISRIVAQMAERKLHKLVLTDGEDFLFWGHLEPWGLPVETLYASALNEDRIQRSAILLNHENVEPVLFYKHNELAGPWKAYPVAELNARYFRMDTTRGYEVLTYAELMR